MKVTILTLFPEIFSYFDVSIIKRAREKGLIDIDFVNPRDFTHDKHRSVDDMPYGGGRGMILKPEPFFDAMDKIKNDSMQETGVLPFVILLSPQGINFNQETARFLAQKPHLAFITGRYEGFDERINSLADMEISVGDFVLTGGELPAMMICDAVFRMIPGVIQEESARDDSFYNGLLDYPQYTRPPVYKGMSVPEILLSGHHENIARWRRKESLRRTLVRRPDLLEGAVLSPGDQKLLLEILIQLSPPPP